MILILCIIPFQYVLTLPVSKVVPHSFMIYPLHMFFLYSTNGSIHSFGTLPSYAVTLHVYVLRFSFLRDDSHYVVNFKNLLCQITTLP